MAADVQRFDWVTAKQIGDRIRFARQKTGIPLTELARASGIDKSNLSRAESGKSTPSSENLPRLAKALGVDIEYLTGENPSPSRTRYPNETKEAHELREKLMARMPAVTIPNQRIQLKYKDELDGRGLSLWVANRTWRPAHFMKGDLLFVSRTEAWQNRDLVFIDQGSGIGLYRYLTTRWDGSVRSELLPQVSPIHQLIEGPLPESAKFGVLVEVRRDREMLQAEKSISEYEV